MLRLTLLVLCLGTVQCIVPGLGHNYDESLKNIANFTDGFMLLAFPVLESQSDENTNLRLALAVLDGLVSNMADKPAGINNYDLIFKSQVPTLFSEAQNNDKKVVDRLRCVIDEINNSIKTLRNIRYKNPIVNSIICEENPSQCNQALEAIIDSANDNGELFKESKLLLALGDASALYTNKYRDLIVNQVHKLSNRDVLNFLVTNKDLLKPLILSATKARKLKWKMNGDRCDAYKLQNK